MSITLTSFAKAACVALNLCSAEAVAPVQVTTSVDWPSSVTNVPFNSSLLSSYNKRIAATGLVECWVPKNVWGDGLDLLNSTEPRIVKASTGENFLIKVCSESIAPVPQRK